MARVAKTICPHCGTALKSNRGIREGREVRCPQCAASFTVRAEEGRPAAPASNAEPTGNQATGTRQPGAVNLARLGVVLGGALLYLLGGAALCVYCFSLNAQRLEAARVGSAREADDDASEPPASVHPAPPTVTVDAAEQRKIDDAIVKGVWYLKGHQLDNGSWGKDLLVGYAALPGLTLLECGLPGSDPVVRKAVEYVRKEAAQPRPSYDTYQLALALLFLDRLGEPEDQPLIQYLALCLLAGRRADDSGWGYMCPRPDRKACEQLLDQLRDEVHSLDEWRNTALQGKPFDPGRSDNSNTQFAVLALWAAGRHGVAIERTMALVEKRFRTSQAPARADPTGNNLDLEGSWYYCPAEGNSNSSRWPTMTCSGLLALAVAHGLDEERVKQAAKPLEDLAVRKALAMLGREIGRADEKRPTDLYFLWSLERVGVLYNLSEIEGKDWYAWGRNLLLPAQKPEGNWQGGAYYGNNPALDTCFALLFLKQANLAKDLTTKLQLLSEKK
jgi:hypothetical protein